MQPKRSASVVMGIVVMALLMGVPWAAAAGTDVVANGSFTTDTAGWSFVGGGGNPTGSWDSAGHANGGAAKTASEAGNKKSGNAAWEQSLGTIEAGSTVTLDYAWKKGYEARKPQVQDLAVRVVKPGGAVATLDAQNGAPAQYNVWSTVSGKDVSASFDATGTYTLQLRYAYKTGGHAQARALAWFDEVHLVVTPPGGGAGGWTLVAPSPGTGAFGEAVAGTSSFLYVVRCASATATPEFWRYDPAADAWATLSVAGLPAGAFRNGATLTWDGADTLLALGGARYSDADRRTFWSYALSSATWTQRADTPAAQGAGDAATWDSTAGRLYALLGSSQHGAAFAMYDPAADAWSSLANPPAGIDDGASLAWTGGADLYAIRGEYFETSPPVQDFWRYDTTTDAWASRSDIPKAAGVGDGGSLVWLGGFDATQTGVLFALGGGDPDETPGKSFFRYTLGTDAWEQLVDLPHPVGNYNGNRLGYASGNLHYWQGAPGTFDGGGDRVAWFDLGT